MFELKSPTTAKLSKVDDKDFQTGNNEKRPGVKIRLKVDLPNTALAMFDPALRQVLYDKSTPDKAAQAAIDGVEDLRADLSPTGENLKHLPWRGEQTGCTLTLDLGIAGDKIPLTLPDGTARGFGVALKPGAISVAFEFHAPIQHLTPLQVGILHLRHQTEVPITLTGPAVKQEQQDLGEEQKPKKGGAKQTPAQALAAQLGQTADADA